MAGRTRRVVVALSVGALALSAHRVLADADRAPSHSEGAPATVEVASYAARVGECGPRGETGPVWETDAPLESTRVALPLLEAVAVGTPRNRTRLELLLLEREVDQGHRVHVEARKGGGQACPTTEPIFGVHLTLQPDAPFTIQMPRTAIDALAVVLRVERSVSLAPSRLSWEPPSRHRDLAPSRRG